MTSTITAFKTALLERMHKTQGDWCYLDGYETSGFYTYVDWDELTREIDELCAEFKARNAAPSKTEPTSPPDPGIPPPTPRPLPATGVGAQALPADPWLTPLGVELESWYRTQRFG